MFSLLFAGVFHTIEVVPAPTLLRTDERAQDAVACLRRTPPFLLRRIPRPIDRSGDSQAQRFFLLTTGRGSGRAKIGKLALIRAVFAQDGWHVANVPLREFV